MTAPAPSCGPGCAAPPPDPRSFRVEGMDCAEEVAAVRRALAPVVPPEALSFDLLRGRLDVAAEVDPEVVRARLARVGLKAEPWDARPQRRAGRRRALLAAASGLFALAGVAVHAAGAATWAEALGIGEHGSVPPASAALYLAAIGLGLWPVLPRAWASARSLRPDMNLLITVAVVGAVAIEQWLEAATVAFLYAVSLVLEGWSVSRARRAVEALLRLAPQRVRLRADGREVDAAEVEPGAEFVVRPGERIGLDGVVVEGRSEVDEAPITGESMPVGKEPGSEVFAGTINGTGALVVRATRRAGDTTLARITRMVEAAGRKRSRLERQVDRFAAVYTPAVFAVAVLVAAVPPLALGAAWSEWVYRALVLLVIGCPCALVISTPVSVVSALASAARRGVLVKGGEHIEVPAQVEIVAMDKTGTLTEGRPAVVRVVALDGHTEEEVLERAAAVEARSEHPLARAIVRAARMRGVEVAPAEDVSAEPGRGAWGRWKGRETWVGSHRWLEERGQETPEVHHLLEDLAGAGRAVVVVGTADHVCGLVALADAVRPGARAALDALRAAGVRRIVLLTGDNEPTARAVAAELGIEEVHAELLPEDKVARVAALAAEAPTAMVGDGVNDAPALAAATLGVAMGAAGTDAAIETADVALMKDDLGRLAWLVHHSRRTVATIRANVAFALGVKALFVVLTAVGAASMWGAVAADTGASLLVTAWALRLLRAGPEPARAAPAQPAKSST